MNEDLFFEGKQFTSVSRASERTGYTSDYLSQLCRGKKIPAKMVGRTWYMDFSALRDYQTSKINRNGKTKEESKDKINLIEKSATSVASNLNLDKSPKISLNNSSSAVLDLPRSSVFKPEFKYEYQKPSSVSILMKKRDKYLHHRKAKRSVTKRVIVNVAVILFIMGSASSLVLNSQILQSRNSEASVIGTFINGWNKFTYLFEKKTELASSPTVDSQGIVVLPESSSTDATVQSVKNAFSDEVNVTFDESGSSGIITPIFRAGENSDNYVFVMVPVKNQK